MSDLHNLIAAVERGDDDEVASLLRDMHKDANSAGDFWPSHDALKAYRGSLDAAKALHDALLPGWDVDLELRPLGAAIEGGLSDVTAYHPGIEYLRFIGCDKSPARAWLLAVLKAKRAKGETE